jgi:hypothetical protein
VGPDFLIWIGAIVCFLGLLFSIFGFLLNQTT